jgi:hypothetical protein
VIAPVARVRHFNLIAPAGFRSPGVGHEKKPLSKSARRNLAYKIEEPFAVKIG